MGRATDRRGAVPMMMLPPNAAPTGRRTGVSPVPCAAERGRDARATMHPPARRHEPDRAAGGTRVRVLWAAAAVAVATVAVRGQSPTTAPAPPASLQQLSDQTQQLYARARLGMVRVRLPTPVWLARENRLAELMAKWGNQLDPSVRERILEEQEQAALAAHARLPPAASPPNAVPTPGSKPALTVPDDDGVRAPSDRVLIATGWLIDSAGHAVFPLFLDRSDLGTDDALAALTGDGRATVATFVGSDRNTNLTVLKLAAIGAGRPAALAAGAGGGRPPDGSLAMVITPDGLAHLTIWTAASTDVGLVVRPDGTFAGFGFPDDFLAAATARPIVDQLVATGVVRRPVLGVAGVAIRRSYLFDPALPTASDPTEPAISDGPSAIYVRTVDADSAAARGGLRPADVILAVAGQSIGPRTFAAVIAARRGATVLRVRRASRTIDLTVDLQLDEGR
jgi:hypothetical protein